jgi:hypothetical protein
LNSLLSRQISRLDQLLGIMFKAVVISFFVLGGRTSPVGSVEQTIAPPPSGGVTDALWDGQVSKIRWDNKSNHPIGSVIIPKAQANSSLIDTLGSGIS